ncbi:hypothetical protein AB1287_02780 [Enterobacter asburiae]|uniref:hypothetical protein n=1 Tax=unclassified Scandinavium TaxID=2830652 RepID=UPI0028975FBD|nr:hypothetical protein [Scandinavium sp.]
MLKNLSVLLLIAVALFASASLTYILWISKHDNTISCVANHISHGSQGNVHGTSHYVFNKTGGSLSLNGYLEEDPTKIFNRKILFDYQRNQNTYVLRSMHNIKYPDDSVSDEWMAQRFPDFYVYEGKDIYIKIIKQFNNNYLFFIGTLPTFSCKRSFQAVVVK